jgi:non-specific serine/threonine protein kinase
LLSPVERTLLERLSVFAGGWTLEAAERVCADPPGDPDSRIDEADVLDLLTTLVDKSLVVYEGRDDGDDRYRLLETVRQYAREKLNATADGERLRNRHLDHAAWLAQRAVTELNGPAQGQWLERLEDEHENLLAALQWCDVAPEGATKGLELSRRLYRFWMVRGHLATGRAALAEALEREAGEAPSSGRARALNAAGALARYHGDYEAARTSSEAALALHRTLDDQRGVAEALDNLGLIASDQGDYDRARSLLEESLAIGRAIDDKTAIARAISNLGMLAWRRGELPFARACIEDALRVNRARGDRRRIARGLHSLAKIAREEGDVAAARDLQRRSLDLHRALGNKQGMGASLAELARLALLENRLEDARGQLRSGLRLLHELGNTDWILRAIDVSAQLAAARHDDEAAAGMFGSVETIRASLRLPMSVGDRGTHDNAVAGVRADLGEAAFERASSEGAGRSLEVAVTDVLAWLTDPARARHREPGRL